MQNSGNANPNTLSLVSDSCFIAVSFMWPSSCIIIEWARKPPVQEALDCNLGACQACVGLPETCA
eukprot:2264058-Amphidinium_carterae.1